MVNKSRETTGARKLFFCKQHDLAGNWLDKLRGWYDDRQNSPLGSVLISQISPLLPTLCVKPVNV